MDYPAVTALARRLYRFRGPSDPFFNEDDAIQEAIIACWQAESRYVEGEGTLMGFFHGVIRYRYRDLYKKATSRCRRGPTISLGDRDFSEDRRIVPTSYIENREDRNQRIFDMRQGGATLASIGSDMGLTQSAICKILKQNRARAEEAGKVPPS